MKAYPRISYKSDSIYTFFDFKEIFAYYSKGLFFVEDRLVDFKKHVDYHAALLKRVESYKDYDQWSVQDIYMAIKSFRQSFGIEVNYPEYEPAFDGINQMDLFAKMKEDNVVYYRKRDGYQRVLEYLLALYPDMEECRGQMNESDLLLDFSDEGLLEGCQRGHVFVVCCPDSYYTKALLNYIKGMSFVYIPKKLNMFECVPLVTRSQLTFSQLNELYQNFGAGIYDMNLQELRTLDPMLFINIYQNDGRRLPVSIGSGENLEEQKEQTVLNALSGFSGVSYVSAYFDENMERTKIPYGSSSSGILVHGVKIKDGRQSHVMLGNGKDNLRTLVRGSKGVHLYSNFLFFLTPKVKNDYNRLREDRLMEQMDSGGGHLDYQKHDGMESFPLYHKACFGLRKDGTFSFFRTYPKTGYIEIGDKRFDFDEKAINGENQELIVYTPALSINNEEKRILVGDGRLNVVMIQDEIICIRKGDVVMPSVGIVLSFKDLSVFDDAKQLQNGYIDKSGLKISIHLEDACYKELEYGFGGGILLIDDGVTFDLETLNQEGWLSPLSKQTQDSAIEKPTKHPRTALGMCENGELVILVYSGRNPMTSGATYDEMVAIARKLYPDIRYLINVDGGGSALMGLSVDGVFMELSYPATSQSNVSGMCRSINTALDVKIG